MSRNIDQRILTLVLVGLFAVGCDSSSKDITSFSFTAADNPGLAADVPATINGTSIMATVPAGTAVTQLVASFTTTGKTVSVAGVDQLSGVTANSFVAPVTYLVTADDGSVKTYTATVTVLPSSAKQITSFAFLQADNPGLSADVPATINGASIAATVPFGTDVTGLIASFTTTGVRVSVNGTVQTSGATANDFTNPVAYDVTAQDGSQQTFTVTVTIAPSTAKELTAFAFLAANNPGLAADVTATINGSAIAATVPFGTNVTALVATFTTTGASVSVNGAAQTSGVTPNDFTNPVDYTVTAADGSTRDFIVTVTIAPSSAKAITSFQFLTIDNPGLAADIDATINGASISATVPNGTDVTALVATFATTGASVTVNGVAQASGASANNFSNPVTYTVTAQDGSTQPFTVIVTIAPPPAKAITSFAFLSVDNPGLPADVAATIAGTNIVATVPFGTDVTALVPTFATTGVSVSVGGVPQTSGTTANDFSSQVVYVVMAADGSTQSFTVTVAIAPSSAKAITSFAFLSADNPGLPADVIATITGSTITAIVPAGTDVTALVATFATTGASASVAGALQASGITPNDFTAAVDYLVTAADGTTADFTVTVTAM